MKIKVFLCSGANIKSTNEHQITTEELDFTDKEWLKLPDDEKLEAVRNYWLEQGLPEYGWEENEI